MEAVDAGCARIDMEHAQCLVELHLQYMRMAADKQLGRAHHDAPLYGRIVLAGIAPYVFHQHFRAVHRKTEHLRIELAQVLPVYIAIYRTKRKPELPISCTPSQGSDTTKSRIA